MVLGVPGLFRTLHFLEDANKHFWAWQFMSSWSYCTTYNPEHVLHWQKTCLQLRYLKKHIICVGTYCLSLHGYAGPSFSTLLLCYLVMDNTAVSATLVNPYFNSYNHPRNRGRRGVEPQIYICCVITGKTALVALASHTEKCKDKYYTFMEEKKGFTNWNQLKTGKLPNPTVNLRNLSRACFWKKH